jgi:nitrate/nitrite-specific signal transduction histidine kinase
MQERAEQIGATFQLTTEPGTGTIIEIHTNLRAASQWHRHQRAS